MNAFATQSKGNHYKGIGVYTASDEEESAKFEEGKIIQGNALQNVFTFENCLLKWQPTP